MSKITLHFYPDKQVVIDASDLLFHKAGGEARIYKLSLNDKKFIVKAMPDNDTIYKRMKVLRERITQSYSFVSDSIFKYAIPVAQGYCDGKDLDNPPDFNCFYLLVFNYMEGETLKESLPELIDKTKIIDFQLRKKIALQIIDILIFFQNEGIVHGDLYNDNFMIDKNSNVFVIDLTSCGFYDITKRNDDERWIWKPAVYGKDTGAPIPPELDSIKPCPTLNSDKWNGLILIWWILTGTLHPFLFLKQNCETKVLNELYNAIDLNYFPLLWAPKLKNNIKSKYFNNQSFNEFQKFFDAIFKKDTAGFSIFGSVLFETFILGFHKPERRTNFQTVKGIVEKL